MIQCQQLSKFPVVVLLILLTFVLKTANTSPVTKNIDSNQYEASQKQDGQQVTLNKEEDELFDDVDPKALAAVLLGSLNKLQTKALQGENSKEVKDKLEEEEKLIQRDNRDKDGHQELELMMTAAEMQGREEREEDEERNKEEQEEQLTEKVTSRTTSSKVPIKSQEAITKEVVNMEEPQEVERGTDEKKEEQLNSEELKNIETMLEEFQSYSTATKRERDSSNSQRESRGDYFDYLDRNGLMNNEIKPKSKGYDLALSKKKLKWQQEEEINKNRASFKGGNFMIDFNDNFENQEENSKVDEEELLSPEEEEARAKAEQDEVRRQAAEAQRAKAEEEKLADIASDMILQYMVKQDGKKYKDAAEDKRSEEEDTNDDDDIDPQTIDKLIEISSKLHLPADDVVDIISDVEKKKKKDAPENLQWQRPLVSPPAPVNPSTVLRAPPSLKPPKPNTNIFKAWFNERAPIKINKQDFWVKKQWPFLNYPSYRFYQNPYNNYYPTYLSPPKPKFHYYAKPSYTFNEILSNPLDYNFPSPLKQRYYPWAPSYPISPPSFRANLHSPFVPHLQTFKAMSMPKPRAPLLHPVYYYQRPASVVTRQDNYYREMGLPQHDSGEELENFIKRFFLKRQRMAQ